VVRNFVARAFRDALRAMSEMGQTATWQQVRATSALPPQSRNALTRLACQFRANRRHRRPTSAATTAGRLGSRAGSRFGPAHRTPAIPARRGFMPAAPPCPGQLSNARATRVVCTGDDPQSCGNSDRVCAPAPSRFGRRRDFPSSRWPRLLQ
jgi:hypothetical protein